MTKSGNKEITKCTFPDVERLPILTELDGRPLGEIFKEVDHYIWCRTAPQGEYYSRPSTAYAINQLRELLIREDNTYSRQEDLKRLQGRLFKPKKVFVSSITTAVDATGDGWGPKPGEREKDLSHPLGERLRDTTEFGRYIPEDELIYALGRIQFNKDTPDEQLRERDRKHKPNYESDLIIYTRNM